MSTITTESSDYNVGSFLWLKQTVLEAARARGKWRKMARECYDFVNSRQWSDDDKAKLQDEKRPMVTFNRVRPIVRAVCGLEINNRQEVVYLARRVGEAKPSEIYTSAAKWLRDEAMAADEESRAFRDLTICGEGWIENRMDYSRSLEGRYVSERIYPLEMGANKGACKPNYSDARLLYRMRDIEAIDAKEMFPGVELGAIHAAWASVPDSPQDGGEAFKRDYPDETPARVHGGTVLGRCRVVQVQWWELETKYVTLDLDGQLTEMSTKDFEVYRTRYAQLKQMPPEATKVRRRRYKEAFIGNTGLLPTEDGQTVRDLPLQEFQWTCMTGEYDEEDKLFVGMVGDMLDPQRWANKWVSQSMAILNANAKGGIMAERDAFENVKSAEENWANPNKIIWLRSGALAGNKVKDRTPPPVPSGLGELLQFALSSLRDTTGVNLELLGQADREQAASLEQQRRESAMTMLATLFNNLRQYRITQGKLMLAFVDMLPPNTLVRVVQKGVVKFLPLIKDPDAKKFDIIVDDAPSSPDQKKMVWLSVMQLLQSGIQFPPNVLIKLLRYSPLPESVVAEIEETMGLGEGENTEQIKQRLAQAEEALKVMEEQLTEALRKADKEDNRMRIEMLKASIDNYKAETERLKMIIDAKISVEQAAQAAAQNPDPVSDGGA